MVELLPATVEALVLTLPGRDSPEVSTPRATLTAVLSDTEETLAALPPLPTVALGCSVGALLAVRVAEHLTPARVCGVVVAGQSPGALRRWPLHVTSDEDLLRVIDLAGGLPAAVLADAGLRRSIVDRLAADLRLGAEAEEGFAEVRLNTPLTVLAGLDDGLVPAHSMIGWPRHTTGPCRVLMLPGGHLAFLEARHSSLVRAVLRDSCATLPG
ncbi:thioesterase [Actinoplanes sp. N902-109]|nr:thioesterase [Actinoplanes sp. N902-109]